MTPYIIGGLAALLALYAFIEYRPRSPRAQFQRHYNDWKVSTALRGLTFEQTQDEFSFRCAWARFTRRASEAAIAHPEHYHDRLVAIAREEAETLAATSKPVAKRFLNVVETMPESDILYPAAMKAILARRPAIHTPDPHDDHITALKTR